MTCFVVLAPPTAAFGLLSAWYGRVDVEQTTPTHLLLSEQRHSVPKIQMVKRSSEREFRSPCLHVRERLCFLYIRLDEMKEQQRKYMQLSTSTHRQQLQAAAAVAAASNRRT